MKRRLSLLLALTLCIGVLSACARAGADDPVKTAGQLGTTSVVSFEAAPSGPSGSSASETPSGSTAGGAGQADDPTPGLPSTPDPTASTPTPVPTVRVLYYGDTRVGVLPDGWSEEDVEEAVMSGLCAGLAHGQSFRAEVEEGEEPCFEPDGAIALLRAEVLSESAEACALYLSGNYIGAAVDRQTVDAAVDGFCKNLEKQLDDGAVSLHDVDTRVCSMIKSEILSEEELEALIGCCLKRGQAVVGVDYGKIMRYASGVELPEDVCVIRTYETFTEEMIIPYRIRTVENPDKNVLYSLVKSEGSCGLSSYTYRITYENGEEVSRFLVEKRTVKEAVDRVIIIGTKQSMLWPLDDWNLRVTSEFGMREHPIDGVWRGHTGVDLAGRQPDLIDKNNIYAAFDGVVTVADNSAETGYGRYIVIDHGTALFPDENVKTLYAHCSELLVKVGQTVKKGQLIAHVGSTGNSTGPHLHFEVRINDVPTDPLLYEYQLAADQMPRKCESFIKTSPY